MPILSNPRHELFAQEIAKGKTAEAAYRLAGYKPSVKNAQRLKASKSVRSRVSEMQSRAAERAIVTVEDLIAEAEEARKGAMQAKQFAAAVSAIKEKGILSGKRVEKGAIIQKRTMRELNYDELMQIAAGGDFPEDLDLEDARAEKRGE
jgi:phage terminase small subunit